MNKIQLMGHISSEPKKREIKGRPVCLFHIDVADRSNGQLNIYTQVVILWDKAAEYALHNFGQGSAVLVEGKLTSRIALEGNTRVLRVEIVAHSITGVDAIRDKKPSNATPAALQHSAGVDAPYPAAEPNEARIDAENGICETEREHLEQEAADTDAAIEADVKKNGLPF